MQLVIEHFAATRGFFLFSRMLLCWCCAIWELSLKIWQQNQSRYQDPKTWLYFRTFTAKQRSSYAWVFCHSWIAHGTGTSRREVCITCSYNPLCREVGLMSMTQPMVHFSHSQLPKAGFCWHGEQPWGFPEKWEVFVTTPGAMGSAKVTSETTLGESKFFLLTELWSKALPVFRAVVIPWIRALSIVGVPGFASQAELHSKGHRFTKTRVVGWRTCSLLPGIWGSMFTWTQALGDCITLPEKGAASSEGLAPGGSGQSPPQPDEPGECGFYSLLSVQQSLLLLWTWQLSSLRPGWWGQKGLAYKISLGKMSPGAGSVSLCHCRPVRWHQAATAWLLSCHWSRALPWAWAGLPSLPVLQDALEVLQDVRADSPMGEWELTGTPGSSIPHSSSFLPAGIPAWMSRWVIPIPTLWMQILGCTVEPLLTSVPCHWMRKRWASTQPHQ